MSIGSVNSTGSGHPILRVKNVSKVYPNGTVALKNVSFEVPKGAFVSVIGLSGSGKSTLLRCINRLHEPSTGQVEFEGRELTALSEAEMRRARRRIAMIFQQFNLVKRRDVLSNVMMGKLGDREGSLFGGVLGRWPKDWEALAMECLETVGIADKAKVRADGLSGGQQQRVAIARSLMQRPSLMLADEPVASLDPSTSNSVMNYLKQLNEQHGVTVLCNLHFLSLVRDYSTHVVALKGGEKVFEGHPSEINEQWFQDIYGEDAKEVEIR